MSTIDNVHKIYENVLNDFGNKNKDNYNKFEENSAKMCNIISDKGKQ